MQSVFYNLENEKVRFLAETDEKLSRLIRHIGVSEIVIENDGFKCLVKYIIGQQISDKVREIIWQRFCVVFQPVTPKHILEIENERLKIVGLSQSKINYIKNLASAIVNGTVKFEDHCKLTNEKIIKELTAIKGIGQWTAEMYLIFSLGREDVLSKTDGTIKRVIQWMYDVTTMPKDSDIVSYFQKWLNYSTIVSSYFWEAIKLGLTQKKFGDIIN